MKSCAFLNMDDYPCLCEGTVKVGTKWFCADHADDMKSLKKKEILPLEDIDIHE